MVMQGGRRPNPAGAKLVACGMRADDFVAALHEVKATAILRTTSAQAGRQAMEAAVRGGFRIVEFTLNTPGALELIREFSGRPGVVVGAGTVLSVDEAMAARAAGAGFLVSPVADPAVISIAQKMGIAIIPGTFTPAEMLHAYRHGAPLQKLFPAPANGPAFVRACLGPMPFLRIVPTNGVDATNAAEYLKAGAWALGFTNSLFVADEILGERWDAIEARARTLLSSLRAS